MGAVCLGGQRVVGLGGQWVFLLVVVQRSGGYTGGQAEKASKVCSDGGLGRR
jgi:hypothetical protein